eukprot:scaffold63755_cov22-Tisochrysis_lutea.AAC.4
MLLRRRCIGTGGHDSERRESRRALHATIVFVLKIVQGLPSSTSKSNTTQSKSNTGRVGGQSAPSPDRSARTVARRSRGEGRANPLSAARAIRPFTGPAGMPLPSPPPRDL